MKFLDHLLFCAYYFAAEIYLKHINIRFNGSGQINVVFVIETSMRFSERYFNKKVWVEIGK